MSQQSLKRARDIIIEALGDYAIKNNIFTAKHGRNEEANQRRTRGIGEKTPISLINAVPKRALMTLEFNQYPIVQIFAICNEIRLVDSHANNVLANG